jgi:hypothetical protein
VQCSECDEIIDAICDLRWEDLSRSDLIAVAQSYYYFSIQFRESLQVARRLYPDDAKLRELEDAECNTDNLSPWPDVAHAGERMNHDEFMRRLLALSPLDDVRHDPLDLVGQEYLRTTRAMKLDVRAGSIASYEDGGLERVFTAILRCEHWETPALKAFKHFLVEHIRFDSDAGQGHGALSRHLALDDSQVSRMWSEFKRILVEAAPKLEAETLLLTT